MQLPSHMVGIYLTLQDTDPMFQSGTSPLVNVKVPSVLHPCQHLNVSVFFILVILVSMNYDIIVVLI